MPAHRARRGNNVFFSDVAVKVTGSDDWINAESKASDRRQLGEPVGYSHSLSCRWHPEPEFAVRWQRLELP
jgi:hypothetical protein